MADRRPASGGGADEGPPLAAVLERIAGQAAAGATILVVGDVMLDRFVAGRVARISPEAPVPVLELGDSRAMPGGAGNVVRNLVALGARPHLLAVRGDDAAGRILAGLVAAMATASADLIIDPGRPTTEKTRFLAGGQQLLRTDRESVAPLADRLADRLTAAAERALATAAALVLSDYGKGTLAADIPARLIRRAAAAGIPVIVDPKGGDYGRYRGAQVATPNRAELAVAAGRPVPAGGEEEAARALLATEGIADIVVTLGGDGMLVVPGAGGAVFLAAEAREVFDVSGAGDTVAAVLAAALAAGAGLVAAARLANAAAGIVVGKVGTAVAGADEIARALRRAGRARLDEKLPTLPALAERVEGWRRRGLRVGFTNGCFDLIHPGHVSLIAQARAACDRLVVGLNSDASVAGLKGPGRPVQDEAARALVLAAMADVDAVAIFAEPTPLRLIEALRPDVLVKGKDYRREDVVGAAFVEGYGGRLLLADLVPGFSTSATLAAAGAGSPAVKPER